ncbi:hypothetical protein GR268_45990 [Rhizobium leguminosarum]|nr:hypothetical protein [Rhizobium leguminosarum]
MVIDLLLLLLESIFRMERTFVVERIKEQLASTSNDKGRATLPSRGMVQELT